MIWGTGAYGGRFASGFDDGEIAFFIDSDINKKGKFFCGKKVLNPDDICDDKWTDLYVFIPENYKLEIEEYLNRRDLKCYVNYEIYGDKLYLSKSKAESDFSRFKKELKNKATEGMIPIIATFWRKHGYINILRRLCHDSKKYILISEVPGEEWEDIPNLICVRAPVFAQDETIIDCDDKCTVAEIGVDEMCIQMKGVFPDESMEKCRFSVYEYYCYIDYVLNIINPKLLICLDSTTVGHNVLNEMCKKKGIKTIYTHPGIIHGTISFDTTGEMGESIPAIYSKQFQDLKIEDLEIEKARHVKKYLYESRLNRKVQPKIDYSQSINEQFKGRPTVLFAGQNDVGSHMVPYTQRSKDFHSPVFKSSTEAAICLANLCLENEWNFIYKPHPMYAPADEKDIMPHNVQYLRYGDINTIIDCSDVVVTILSTAGYDAIIRNKPVVMLGYTQAKGKGITYEAFDKREIEEKIRDALENGNTYEMTNNFDRHLAQCLKYYLYDDGEERSVRYGKSISSKLEELYELERLVKDNNY